LFCGHHANEHTDRLRELGATIVSESDATV